MVFFYVRTLSSMIGGLSSYFHLSSFQNCMNDMLDWSVIFIFYLILSQIVFLFQKAAAELKALEEDHTSLKTKWDATKARYT